MKDQIIESLKSWFEKEWLYDRYLTTEFTRDKEAFKKGCEYFDNKNYSFHGELGILLRKESGLAEVSRINNDLEKYAKHCFNQVEKVLSEFILINPGREKLGEYLLNGNDLISNPTLILELNPTVSNILSHSYNNSLNKSCLILKLNFLKIIGNRCYHFQSTSLEGNNSSFKSKRHSDWSLSQSQQEKIFKSVLYFETFGENQALTKEMNMIKNKPSLFAFNHMYHFRNLGSHLNSQESFLRFPENINAREKKRLSIFYKNPTEVMNINNESPGFYQRYVDAILFLYSEYLKKNNL
jgi:hypothetical protein